MYSFICYYYLLIFFFFCVRDRRRRERVSSVRWRQRRRDVLLRRRCVGDWSWNVRTAGRLKKERACVITFLLLVTGEQNAWARVYDPRPTKVPQHFRVCAHVQYAPCHHRGSHHGPAAAATVTPTGGGWDSVYYIISSKVPYSVSVFYSVSSLSLSVYLASRLFSPPFSGLHMSYTCVSPLGRKYFSRLRGNEGIASVSRRRPRKMRVVHVVVTPIIPGNSGGVVEEIEMFGEKK